MRKVILIAAAFAALGLACTSASAMPGIAKAAVTPASAVVQVHSGPWACHWVRGRYWRDTRPYSRPCYGRGWNYGHHHHRHCHCWWRHYH